jgi:F0F1-type ATP synthase membrane subunit b/b'
MKNLINLKSTFFEGGFKNWLCLKLNLKKIVTTIFLIKACFVKKVIFFMVNILVIVAVTISLSFASEGETSELVPMFIDFGLKVLNLSILIGIIAFFARKPLKNFLRSRRENIEEGIKKADDSVEAVTKEYKESEERLSIIAEDIKQIKERLTHEGKLEKEKIIKIAYEKAQKIKDQTGKSIKREFEIIHKKLKEETIERTINSAEEVLKSKFKPSDQNRFAEMVASEIKAYEKHLSELTNISKAFIYSATDISETALNIITTSLRKTVGKDIEVEVVKDTSIIGGIITKISSLVFDASIRTQLENMKENLKKEVV